MGVARAQLAGVANELGAQLASNMAAREQLAQRRCVL